MLSMTGYGSAKTSIGQAECEINVKTVNNRFLDLRIHLPRPYISIEPDIKKIVKRHFSRGTVDVYINRVAPCSMGSTKISTNIHLARKWLKAYKKLESSLNLKKESPYLKEILLHVPSVIQIDQQTSYSKKEHLLILQQVQKAIKSCLQERKKEGTALRKDIQKQLHQLKKVTQNIETFKEKANKALSKKYKARLQHLSLQKHVDDVRVAQEIAIIIDKTDINEEISRLKTHISNFQKLLTSPKPQGKKLDFYAQELLREINTIGSKAQLSAITKDVVSAKSLVEKIREQVQNIE